MPQLNAMSPDKLFRLMAAAFVAICFLGAPLLASLNPAALLLAPGAIVALFPFRAGMLPVPGTSPVPSTAYVLIV